ncbi:MAG: hypothetical protein V2I82_02930 [Halieaceae bacterium]|jgi:hypothetical protein|nr:hypothetical protein [Halieaceae bacterium]
MEYGAFKALQALLFFGAAFGFGIWQLVTVNREIRRDAEGKETERGS